MEEELQHKLDSILNQSEREKTILLAAYDVIQETSNPISATSLFGVIFNILEQSLIDLRNGFEMESEEDVVSVDRVRGAIVLLKSVSQLYVVFIDFCLFFFDCFNLFSV